MKKLLLIVFMFATIGTAAAQEIYSDGYGYEGDEYEQEPVQEEQPVKVPERFRAKYFNFNFGFQGLFLHDDWGSDYKLGRSRWGVGFTSGQTFVLTDNPIAGLVRIGIDATWLDLHFTRIDVGSGMANDWYQAEFGMGIGPSVHISPMKGVMNVHFYAHYNPTFSSIIASRWEGAMGGYSSVIVAGAAISWNVLSLGIEGRWGFGGYKDFDGANKYSDPYKLRTKGGRVYLGFRF